MRHAITSVVAASLLLSGCANALGARATHAGATAAARATRPQPAAARTAASAPAPASPGTASPAGRSAAGPGGRAAVVPHQMVTVVAASYGATYARLTAYHRVRGRWLKVLGPWTARIGRRGMAPPGRKREGDQRTPSGDFAFGFFFGAEPNPGVAFKYRRAHPYDFWDDDPSSPFYNEWVDERYGDPGAAPEPMDVSGYDYGAVIAYNTARTPGLGSAIFLHVNIGTATSGCITLPMGQLLRLLRWLRPAQSPRIVLGVAASPQE
jgi:L,D-peptidoglycan transpeptidase YkuD (ErfK/YbiS/YcfS/YnhG family)